MVHRVERLLDVLQNLCIRRNVLTRVVFRADGNTLHSRILKYVPQALEPCDDGFNVS